MRKKFALKGGVAAVVINRNKILLLKRRNVPIIVNPGIWNVVTGGREKGERYSSTVYRELHEETGLEMKNLVLISKPKMIVLYDRKNPTRLAQNMLFIFRTKTDRIKLNLENSGYRWASYDELENEKNYSNVFVKKKMVLRMIRSAMRGSG